MHRLNGNSILVVSAILVSTATARGQGPVSKATKTQQQLFTGRVVLLEDALERRDIKVAEEMHGQVVLETEKGELIPILADWRGRAFYQDERLRNRKVDLVGFRREGLPYLQVQMVFTFSEAGQRQYTDYWCDICAIPMYEIKPCECCQGPIRLRFQKQDLPKYLRAHERLAAENEAADGGENRPHD